MEAIFRRNEAELSVVVFKILFFFAKLFRAGEFNYYFYSFLSKIFFCTADWNASQKLRFQHTLELQELNAKLGVLRDMQQLY